jgi:cold-inducible RNA-binding protein
VGAGIISAKVFVGNLNYRTTKEELSAFLGAAGEIVDCFLPTDRETGRPRGFGFVTFASSEQATACVEKFNGADFNGRSLNINAAEERGRRPAPGGGGGGPPRGRPAGGGGGDRRPAAPFKRSPSAGGPPPRRGFSPPPEPAAPVFDTSDRQYKEHEGPTDEWGSPMGKTKKRSKGSRRNLRARKDDVDDD